MGFTSLTPAQTDSDSPIPQDVTDLIRTNLDDLNTRVSAALAGSAASIFDDFLLAGWTAGSTTASRTPPGIWTDDSANGGGGGGTDTLKSPGSFDLFHASGTVDRAAFYGSQGMMRCDMDLFDFTQVLEFRVKTSASLTSVAEPFLGLQNAALTGANLTDQTNVIGLVRSATSGKWNVRVASGGTPTTLADVALQSGWHIFRFTMTQDSVTPGNRQIVVEVDGVAAAGSPVTTNIPLQSLRPVFALVAQNGTADGDKHIYGDYVLFYPTSRPLEL